MSTVRETSVFIYAMVRDYGFAPNPFHGYCTLATCKPRIRNPAAVGDWVIGMGGGRLDAVGRCIYAMRVSKKISFDEYWADAQYVDKKPIRNGSSRAMAGDNIYHRNSFNSEWMQADSHHSNADGTTNHSNLKIDTGSQYVLISDNFYYFGRSAPMVPAEVLERCGYRKNPRAHRRIKLMNAVYLIEWLEGNFGGQLNFVSADPYDFDQAHHRYDAESNRVR